MGDPTPVSFGKGSAKTRTGLEGTAEFVNAYLEDLGDQSKTGFAAYAINGKQRYATLSPGTSIRAMLDLDDRLLAVCDRNLFYVPNAGGSPVLVGGIGVDGFCTMARNRRTPNPQAFIVVGGSYWTYQNGVLTVGADPFLPPPAWVIQHHGYFICGIQDGRVYASDLDAVTFTGSGGLSNTIANTVADTNVMGAPRGPDLLIFGRKHTDIYNDVGSSPFPYQRIMALMLGCWAAGSVQNVTLIYQGSLIDTVIFAATDHDGAFAGVYMLQGYQPVKVSSDEVDRLIRDEPSRNNISSMAWTEDGHVFYVLSGSTWSRAFDSRTMQWHTMQSYGQQRWQYSAHAFCNGLHLFGCASQPLIHSSSPTLFLEDGNPIRYAITTPIFHAYPHGIRVNALHIDALTGSGAVSTNDPDANPNMMLDYSVDGGKTYGPQRLCALGAAGQTSVRIKERIFGRFDGKGVSFRMSCTANIMKGIQGMAIDSDPTAAL